LQFFPATVTVVVGWLATVCLGKALGIPHPELSFGREPSG